MILSTNFSEVFLLIPSTSSADNASSLAVLLFWKEILSSRSYIFKTLSFNSRKEREIFRLLISVSGIGASIARTMLSSLSPEQIIQGISIGDSAMIQSVKGIGLKTSQRVIIELKDKVLKIYDLDDKISFQNNNTAKEEALSALEVLGINKKTSEKLVDKIILDNAEASVEIIIKEALKNL
jgi:Holliday junction DNA helicase RuvA